MKVIVTGGCGFVGSHLVESLVAEGREVLIIDDMSNGSRENLRSVSDMSRVTIVQEDISQPGSWQQQFSHGDWVVHLASQINILQSIEDPKVYFDVTAGGTFRVLEAARQNKIGRFVYVNSGACFGNADTYPTPEDARKDPQYPYALFKLIGEEMVLHWASVYRLPANSVRFFNLYGPRCGALFGLFLSKLREKEPLTVTGDGSQTRDFTYITDAVSAIIAVLKSEVNGEVFNIGSGTTVSVNRVAELLGATVQYIPRREGEMECTFGDISKAKAMLDWEPSVSIEEGVKLLMKYE